MASVLLSLSLSVIKRIQCNRCIQVIWRKVCVAHCHHDSAMSQYLLKHQNVAATHHKVTGKGMSQNMCSLSLRQFYAGPF